VQGQIFEHKFTGKNAWTVSNSGQNVRTGGLFIFVHLELMIESGVIPQAIRT
jgi:hypothetical protein